MSILRRYLFLFVACLIATNASAGTWCWDAAGAAQNVSPIILRAIAAQESQCGQSNYHRNVTSADHGPMQINDSWLRDVRFRRLGVTFADLYEPCTANYIAAWVVATCYKQYGVTWQAIGCYNAQTYSKQMKYANDIYQRIQRYLKTGKGIC